MVEGRTRLRACRSCYGLLERERLPLFCAATGFDVGSQPRLAQLLGLPDNEAPSRPELTLASRAITFVTIYRIMPTSRSRREDGGSQVQQLLQTHAVSFPQEGPHALLRALPDVEAVVRSMSVYYVGPSGRREDNTFGAVEAPAYNAAQMYVRADVQEILLDPYRMGPHPSQATEAFNLLSAFIIHIHTPPPSRA